MYGVTSPYLVPSSTSPHVSDTAALPGFTVTGVLLNCLKATPMAYNDVVRWEVSKTTLEYGIRSTEEAVKSPEGG